MAPGHCFDGALAAVLMYCSSSKAFVASNAQCLLECLSGCHLGAGYSGAQLFGQGVTYTYDDVIFLPGYIDFAAHDVRRLHTHC